MDIFVEQLIKKKKTAKDYIRIVACILGVFVILFALAFGLAIPGIGAVIFVVCFILVYVMYMLITATNLEYEYCFTNGLLDIDKIINVRSRKKVAEINVRKIDIMATRENNKFEGNMSDKNLKKLYACTDIDADDLCFMIFYDEKGTKKMLLFNPNDYIKDGIKRYNPERVFLND